MNRRFEHLIPFLLSLNLAVLIWLAATSSSCDTAQWMVSGLPGWMQALGTIAAVWIAWKAFSEWRHPELAKARANQAHNILPKVQSLNTAILMVRTPGRTFGDPIRLSMMKRYLSEDRTRNMQSALERTKELAGLSGLILDDRVKADVDTVLQQSIELDDHYSLMESIIDEYDDLDENDRLEFEANDYEQQSIRDTLVAFGCRPRGPANARVPDDFGRELRERVEAIRLRLRRHIQFEDG